MRYKTCGTVTSEEALHKHDPRVACPANHDDDDDADAVGHSFNWLFSILKKFWQMDFPRLFHAL